MDTSQITTRFEEPETFLNILIHNTPKWSGTL